MMNSALDDSLAVTSVEAKCEHLSYLDRSPRLSVLLHSLLYRGEYDYNRALFGDEWKKVFAANLEALGMSKPHIRLDEGCVNPSRGC